MWNQCYDPESGLLLHEIFEGLAQTPGYLSDYALLGSGLLALFDYTAEPKWLARSVLLADAMLHRFSQPEGRLSASDAADLLVASLDTGDDAYPSDVSAAIDFLIRLNAVVDNPAYGVTAVKAASFLTGRIEANPALWATTVVALNDDTIAPKLVPAGIGNFPQAESADHVVAAVRAAERQNEAVVTLRVDAGYHINANPASLDFLIPTRVEIAALQPLSVDYPRAVRFTPSFAEHGIDVYEGVVEIRISFPPIATFGKKGFAV